MIYVHMYVEFTLNSVRWLGQIHESLYAWEFQAPLLLSLLFWLSSSLLLSFFVVDVDVVFVVVVIFVVVVHSHF